MERRDFIQAALLGSAVAAAGSAPVNAQQARHGEGNLPGAYEPLTSGNAALVLVDHQVGLMSGVRDYSIAELKHNVVALAKAAQALKLP